MIFGGPQTHGKKYTKIGDQVISEKYVRNEVLLKLKNVLGQILMKRNNNQEIGFLLSLVIIWSQKILINFVGSYEDTMKNICNLYLLKIL